MEDSNRNSGQIGIRFFERKNKRATWFGSKAEDMCWEQWVLDVRYTVATSESERSIAERKTTEAIRDVLINIVLQVNGKRGMLPPIITTDAVPYPYEIVIAGTESNDTWGYSMFKKMLADQ
jgi:hypothetical protein